MTSARPFDTALSVENRWNTRTGSSVLSTVTADPRRMRRVRAGDGRKNDLGRRDRKVGTVMLTHAKRVETHLVGQYGLVDHVTQHARLRLQAGRRRRS